MVLERNHPLPLYQQLKEVLLKNISDGVWEVGSVIPPETELAKELHVSRATVRQAVLELVRAGYLHRIQGKGTLVTEPKVEPIGALTSFTENMKAVGITPGRDTLEAEWKMPPREVGAQLQQEGKEALYVERLLVANGTPLALQRAWYPLWLVQGQEPYFTKAHLDHHSLYEVLETRCGAILDTAEETIDITMPSPEEAALLDIAEEKPLMVIHRTTYDPAGKSIESVQLLFRSDRYRYRVTLSRSQLRR